MQRLSIYCNGNSEQCTMTQNILLSSRVILDNPSEQFTFFLKSTIIGLQPCNLDVESVNFLFIPTT